MLYPIILSLHNLGRWIVLAAAVWALLTAWHGVATRRNWTTGDRRTGFAFTHLLELQMALGIALYVISPLVRPVFSGLGYMMSGPVPRFFTLEHPLQMLLAVAAAQVGYSLAKRAEGDRRKFVRAAVGYTVAILLILAAVPWTWGDQARPLLRLPW